jgi:hypothetical protein
MRGGLEVVTPLNAAKWHLTEQDGTVSLRPSVGNWSFPCQSHYWIVCNQVRWAEGMSPERIAAVKDRDKRDVEAMASKELSLLTRFVCAVVNRVKGLFERESRYPDGTGVPAFRAQAGLLRKPSKLRSHNIAAAPCCHAASLFPALRVHGSSRPIAAPLPSCRRPISRSRDPFPG